MKYLIKDCALNVILRVKVVWELQLIAYNVMEIGKFNH